ncbi:MAG: hypothetical protein ACLR7Z_20750 [Bilophila wadsworthia]
MRAFSQAVTDETLMRSPLRHALFPSAIKHSRSSGALTMPSQLPVQAVATDVTVRAGRGQNWLCRPRSMIQQYPAGPDLPRSLQRGIRLAPGLQAFFKCLHSDIGFRYEIDAPLWRIVWDALIGVDDGAAFLDDGKGLQGQW